MVPNINEAPGPGGTVIPAIQSLSEKAHAERWGGATILATWRAAGVRTLLRPGTGALRLGSVHAKNEFSGTL